MEMKKRSCSSRENVNKATSHVEYDDELKYGRRVANQPLNNAPYTMLWIVINNAPPPIVKAQMTCFHQT